MAATALLYFVNAGARAGWASIPVVASNYGFAVGESFTSSFLPDLGPAEELGRISGYAWGLGYIGGIAMHGARAARGRRAPRPWRTSGGCRLVGPDHGRCSSWWRRSRPSCSCASGARRSVLAGGRDGCCDVGRAAADRRRVARAGRVPRSRCLFFAALFFAMAGLSIVIAFAFVYGDQVIRLEPEKALMLMFVITNLAASAGAVGFGSPAAASGGNLRTFNLTLAIWVAAIVGIRERRASPHG